MKVVLILGASGLLGRKLLSGAYLHKYHCLSQGRGSESDMTVNLQCLAQIQDMLLQTQPSIIINLVALTNVDVCERFPNEAFMVNFRLLQNIIGCGRLLVNKPRIIHISTDQVYDGPGPHTENNVNLSNYYAYSKYLADMLVENEGGVVLRTNFFGKSRSENRTSFTDWIYQELSASRHINVFEDILFSPLSMHTLCTFIEKILETNIQGIFNIGSHEGFSKAEFAFRFAHFAGLPVFGMSRVNTYDVDYLKTYRPKDMRLNVSLIERTLNLKMPSLNSEIELASKEYKQ